MRPKEGTGTMRIGLASIFVDDQDQAEQFYTQILGFQVKTNAPYGPNERWLTVVSPEEPDGVELVLHLADAPAQAFQAASRQAGRPVLSLRTDDCQGEAERLEAKGVVLVKEPDRRDYGGIDAVLPTAAATCSTCTRTDRRRHAAHLRTRTGIGSAERTLGAGAAPVEDRARVPRPAGHAGDEP